MQRWEGQPLLWGHYSALTAVWSTTITSSTKCCCAAARLPWGQRRVRVLRYRDTLCGARPLGDLPSVARGALFPLPQGGGPARSSAAPAGPPEGGTPRAALGRCWCPVPVCSSWCPTARGGRWGRTEELGYGDHPIISTVGVGSGTTGLWGSPKSSAGTEVGPGAREALDCPVVAAVLLQQRRGLRIQPQAGVPQTQGQFGDTTR